MKPEDSVMGQEETTLQAITTRKMLLLPRENAVRKSWQAERRRLKAKGQTASRPAVRRPLAQNAVCIFMPIYSDSSSLSASGGTRSGPSPLSSVSHNRAATLTKRGVCFHYIYFNHLYC
jgi:hypothetical protein